MSAAIDHLGAHKLVKVLCRFEDATGAIFEAGETGRIRHIHYDWKTMVCTIELVQGEELRKIVLPSPASKAAGPKPGNLKQYFEVTGMEVVWEASDGPKASFYHPDDPDLAGLAETEQAQVANPQQSTLAEWNEGIHALDLKDRLEEAENRIKDRIPNAYYALEIASLYRSRWRRFTAAGDLVRAEEAREKASDWAYTFASFATSGGEGAAFSYERNKFLATLK